MSVVSDLIERVAASTAAFERDLKALQGKWAIVGRKMSVFLHPGTAAYRQRYRSTGLAQARRRAGKRA